LHQDGIALNTLHFQRHVRTNVTVGCYMFKSNVFYTTKAVCTRFQLNEDAISEMISWGIAAPVGNKPGKWAFTEEDCERIGCASRFNKDLEINIPGTALALQLLEEIQNLRNKEN